MDIYYARGHAGCIGSRGAACRLLALLVQAGQLYPCARGCSLCELYAVVTFNYSYIFLTFIRAAGLVCVTLMQI